MTRRGVLASAVKGSVIAWVGLSAVRASAMAQTVAGLHRGPRRLLDPAGYARAADRALAAGDHDRALTLMAQAYLAFDANGAAATAPGQRMK